MNKCTLIGHVGKDPEIKNLEGGKMIASFSLATSKKYKDKNGETQNDTQWHRITAWGKLAELIEKYIVKGSHIAVEGEIKYRSYDDKNGEKRYVTDIMINSLEFLSKAENTKTENSGLPESDTAARPVSEIKSEMGMDESDGLPF